MFQSPKSCDTILVLYISFRERINKQDKREKEFKK